MTLAWKMFLHVVLILAVILGGTGWLSIIKERESLQAMQVKQANLLATSLATFSVEALLSQDYPALDQSVQTILEHSGDYIIHLSINQEGRTLVSYGEPGDATIYSAPVVLDTNGQRTIIGQVHLALSNTDGEALMSARKRDMIVASIVLFLVLAISLHSLMHRLVLHRIERLIRETEGILAECAPERADITQAARQGRGDELFRLHQRYRALLQGIESREMARNQALAAAQSSRALLDGVANALPAALIVLDAELRIRYMNPSAHKMAEPCAPPVECDLLTRFPILAARFSDIEPALRQARTLELHRISTSTVGQRRIVNVAVYPLDRTQESGAVIRIDDVTERTRFEEAMIQSEKLSSIGGLAAGVAHEINNPLGVMVQAAQNIERRLSPSLEANQRVAAELEVNLEKIHAYLEKRSILTFLEDIKNDGARAARIVRNLLEFSRKSEPLFELTALPDLIERAIELARKDYDLKKDYDFRRIDIRTEYAADLPPVRLIRSEVEQVLLNLLRNAAQAMSDRSEHDAPPSILIQALVQEEHAIVRIADNGPGFSEEARRRAFEPFFTTKAPGIGTGLGLWVSYMIIADKHQGEMTLDSQPGHGATFTLRFPL